jgi:hypothetical protein
MRFASGDVGDHIVSHKTSTGHRIGATGLCYGRDVKNQLSRNFWSRSIFNFCNSIGGKADIAVARVEVRPMPPNDEAGDG